MGKLEPILVKSGQNTYFPLETFPVMIPDDFLPRGTCVPSHSSLVHFAISDGYGTENFWPRMKIGGKQASYQYKHGNFQVGNLAHLCY